jgi:hypothetical protein
MAYGVTGDLKPAKETFEYGLSEDPQYPMFYCNMACTCAEMNDLQNTMAYLKKAFEYKANVIRGEGMPDPPRTSFEPVPPIPAGSNSGGLERIAKECAARSIRIGGGAERIHLATHIFTQPIERNTFFDAVDTGLR